MKIIIKPLSFGVIAMALLLGASNLSAQQRPDRPGRENFDPEQIRQRIAERLREQLEVTNDDEWKIIGARVEKVTQLRIETSFGGGFGGLGFGRGPRPRGDGNAQAGEDDSGRRGGRGGRGFFDREPNPEAEALQKALESKASAEELKAKLAKLREARKEKEAKLEQAQEDLRKVLSTRQEATAVMLGLLK